MRIVIYTDVFGQTSHVEVLAAHLRGRGHMPEIISPFVAPCSLSGEAEAYALFMQVGGVESYKAKIRAGLQEAGPPLVCIGFSAGAAALWRTLAKPEGKNVEKAILFYGGQIRDAVELQPRCETILVFPAEEPHFSVFDLIDRLQEIPGISCRQVPWLHGYMNRLSRNFDLEGYQRTLIWLDELLDLSGQGVGGGDIFRPLINMGS